MSVRTERKKEHKRIAIAIAISLLIHLLIIVAALILLSLQPLWKREAAPPGNEPVELTIVPPPEPEPTPEEKLFFDSTEGQLAEKPPEDAVFESDRDTAAASTQPAMNDEPIPSTDGTDDVGLTLQDRDLSLGPNEQPAPPSPESPQRQPQRPTEQQSKPEPTPEKTPTPTPEPSPTPKPTPRPEDSELALLDPTRPPPKPAEETPEQKPEEPSPPSRPQPPSFQPQTRVTRLTGGISSRGQSSVAAMATPLGRYKKQISDAIGSRWYYYVNDMMDLVTVGTVQLRFVVRHDGKVEGVQVLRNSSNESLASCSVRSIIEAEIPPMSKEVAEVLAGSRLEIDFSFTVGAARR